MNPTLREIVAAYLRGHGYDGLYNDHLGCGCPLDDLMPDMPSPRCKAGYKVPCHYGNGGIGPRPERASEDPDRADVDLARAVGLEF